MCQHNLCCKYSVLLTNTDEVQTTFNLVCDIGSFVDFTLTVEVMHSIYQFSVNVLNNFLCFCVCIYVICYMPVYACLVLFCAYVLCPYVCMWLLTGDEPLLDSHI